MKISEERRPAPGNVRFSILALTIIVSFSAIFPLAGCKKKAERRVEPAGKAEKKEEKTAQTTLEVLSVSTTPRDGGVVWKLQQPISARFSREIDANDFSFDLMPDPGGWTVSWDKSRRTVWLAHSGPFQAGAAYAWKLTVSSKEGPLWTTSVRFKAYGPSSLDLIDEAERSQKLDLDQAWKYRLYAVMTPEKLPDEYRSATPIPSGTPIMIGFSKIENKLKPETRQELLPYLVRPTDPRSIYRERIIGSEKEETRKTEIPSSQAKMTPTLGLLFAQEKDQEEKRPEDDRKLPKWYVASGKGVPIKTLSRKSMNAAETAMAQIINYSMYDKFKGLLVITPLSDAGFKYRDGIPNDGGDGDLDIYLVPAKPYLKYSDGIAAGMCVPVAGGQKIPAYILVDESLSGKYLASVLAHELFHAFQFAIDAWEDLWWMESSAVWAQDYIGKDWDTEQDYLPEAFGFDNNTLKPLTSEVDLHEYGIYLFPYYLSTKFGNEIIGKIWRTCESQASLDAIQSSVGEGGLNERFKEFAWLTLDVAPDKGAFVDASGPIELFDKHFDRIVDLEDGEETGKKPSVVDFMLGPLSAIYVGIYNHLDAERTPHVRFDLGMIKRIPNITIEAVIDPGTKNKKEDWTGLEEKTFCLNNEAEKFDQIELAIASKSRQLPLFSALYIEADAKGCREADLTVTYNIDNTQATSYEEKGADTVVTHKEERHEKTNALFLYKLERTGNENLKGYGLVREERYKRQSIESSSGTGNWEKVDDFRNRSAGSATSLELKLSGILKTIREPEYLSIYYDPKTDRPLKVDFVINPPIDGDFDWEGEYRQVETRRSGTKTSSRKEEIKQLPRLRPFPILESEIEKGKKVESWDKQGNRFSGVFRWDTTAANVTHFKGSASWEMVRKRQ